MPSGTCWVTWRSISSSLSFVSLNWIFLKPLILWKSMILKTRGLPRNAEGVKGHVGRRWGWQISRAALAWGRGRGTLELSITWEPDSMDQISQDLSLGDYLLNSYVHNSHFWGHSSLSPSPGGFATPSQCLSPPSVSPQFHSDTWKDDSDEVSTAQEDKNNVKCRDWELIGQTGHGI